MNMSTLKNLIMNSIVIKSGVDALFIQMCDKWGFKFFQSDQYCSLMSPLSSDYNESHDDIEHARNNNYKLQQQFYDLQLAPKTGQKIDFNLDMDLLRVDTPLRNTYVCGFMTEVVEVCGDAFTHCSPNGSGDYFRQEKRFFTDTKWGGLHDCLMDKLRDYGLSKDVEYDLHINNWGVNKIGEPVVIDFSRIGKSG